MLPNHLIRVGTFGHVGRFTPVDPVSYPRGTRVVCRTNRGLEIGLVLATLDPGRSSGDSDGELLRAVTVQDDLLLARLDKNKAQAYDACVTRLAQRGIAAVLTDVEQLFDGKTIYFYFLGEITPDIETVTTELAETYQTQIQFRRFADTLAHGCGPDCGTEDAANGCSSACGTCAIAGGCSATSVPQSRR